MPPLLHVRGVEARYGRLLALGDVSLIVPEGGVVALLGPNGAGKTTMLRAISGMLAPTRGEILLDGRPIQGLPDYAVARLGVVHIPEGRGLFPGLSVRENLAMAVSADGETEGLGRVYEIFPVLHERGAQLAGTLSGGEQQMLSLARAIIVRPRLLMVDELSLGLAPRLVSELFAALAQVREEGTSILLVEQYVHHALRLADIVVILGKGHVQFIGEPGELEHESKLVAAYLGTSGAASLAPPSRKPRTRRKPEKQERPSETAPLQ
jgi:branched-chain amino acid transport system ATP-binding protein